MDTLKYLFDLFLHLDIHLKDIISQYGAFTYLILFLIIFAETGFVVTPFLPGDSLLFAAGTFAALGSLDIALLFGLLFIAAVAGDNLNYTIGNFIGPKIFDKNNIRFLKKEYLDRTHQFYEKHGGQAVILARFFPIIRTFSPFVAGLGKMKYRRFLSFDIIGGIIWVSIFLFGGYFFGNLPFVKNNFSLVIIAIVLISVLPAIIGALKQRKK